MAFQTGTSTSLDDLRTKIRVFLSAQGFTVTGGNCIHNGSDIYFDLEYLPTELGGTYATLELRPGTGESGGAVTGHNSGQHRINARGLYTPGYPTPIMSFPVTYYFCWDAVSETFVCIVSYNEIFIQWLAFGKLTKIGTWAGGVWYGGSYGSYYTVQTSSLVFRHEDAYWSYSGPRPSGIAFGYATRGASVFGSGSVSPNMSLQCDVDGTPGDWIGNTIGVGDELPCFSFTNTYAYLRWMGLSSFNNKMILHPALCGVRRTSNKISIVGYLPTIRFCKITNYAIGDIVTIGLDKWIVFPLIRKEANQEFTDMLEYSVLPGSHLRSGFYGFAIRYDGP